MTPPTDHDSADLEALPSFQRRSTRVDGAPLEDLDELLEDPAPGPTSPPAAPPTTSSTPSSPPTPAASSPTPQSSSTGSTDPSPSEPLREIADGAIDSVAQIITPGIALLGVGANRLYRRRTGIPDRRWALTKGEAEGLGEALARIAARRIPEEITEGENGDYLALVAIGSSYLLRNILNLDAEDLAAAREDPGRFIDTEATDIRRDVVDQGAPPPGPRPLSAEDVGAQ